MGCWELELMDADMRAGPIRSTRSKCRMSPITRRSKLSIAQLCGMTCKRMLMTMDYIGWNETNKWTVTRALDVYPPRSCADCWLVSSLCIHTSTFSSRNNNSTVQLTSTRKKVNHIMPKYPERQFKRKIDMRYVCEMEQWVGRGRAVKPLTT
jgi:hypothetical protein